MSRRWRQAWWVLQTQVHVLSTHEFDFSVVIPAFKAAPFIDRAIQSALRQETVSTEIVVVDDACPLMTGRHVADAYKHLSNVRVVHLEKNSGPAYARNIGFAAARGEWIAILDADDAYEPSRLHRLRALARKLNVSVIADNVRFYDPVSDKYSRPAIRTVSSLELLDKYKFVSQSKPGTGQLDFGLLKPIFNADTLRESGICYREDIRHGEDFLFYLELFCSDLRVALTGDVGYNYTVRSAGLSQTRVDYGAVASDTRRVCEETFVRQDEKLVNLLKERARALDELALERKFEHEVTLGNMRDASLACIAHPRLLLTLARLLKRSALRRPLFRNG